MKSIEVRPLDAELPYGARVSGISYDALADEGVREDLRQVFRKDAVIVFEGVEPTAKMQMEISQVFGPLKEHPVPSVDRADADKLLGVIEISAHDGACVVEIDGQPLVTWQPWHFDHAYNDELNYAGVLRSVKIAEHGGKTGFADGVQIWNDMAPGIRAKAEKLEMIYNLDLRYTEQKFGLPKNFHEIRSHDQDWSLLAGSKPRAVHPAVWTRASGEKVFHMTAYGCQGIVGDESPAAFELLSEIWEEAMRVVRPYYHQWHETDMVIWDNLRVLHEACGCPPGEERIVHRTTIKGDYGLGRFEEKMAANA